ncbi:MAG: hypothetical protein IPN75_05940 [Dechloromonas sp.]|uniref:Uncharacterized protein n=1 Tax=Candidatus Dechloromonas phosphorivorans TaxID=2899244 RepID=A0A9D7QI96_9RHOO|nr:hypothetical protein [Candidatus Dechloromonas phosphorivorans]
MTWNPHVDNAMRHVSTSNRPELDHVRLPTEQGDGIDKRCHLQLRCDLKPFTCLLKSSSGLNQALAVAINAQRT